MTLLAVAVAVVGVLCLIDLVLTLGVVRRLRDHTSRLTAMNAAALDIPSDALRAPGTPVDPFTVTDIDGVDRSLGDLAEPTLVAFFAPDCPACEEKLPAFLAYASLPAESYDIGTVVAVVDYFPPRTVYVVPAMA